MNNRKQQIMQWCYKYYDKRGRRLTVGGIYYPRNENKIVLYIVPCSKNDQFIKSVGKTLIQSYINNEPCKSIDKYIIPVEDKKQPFKSMFKFLDTFYTKIVKG